MVNLPTPPSKRQRTEPEVRCIASPSKPFVPGHLAPRSGKATHLRSEISRAGDYARNASRRPFFPSPTTRERNSIDRLSLSQDASLHLRRDAPRRSGRLPHRRSASLRSHWTTTTNDGFTSHGTHTDRRNPYRRSSTVNMQYAQAVTAHEKAPHRVLALAALTTHRMTTPPTTPASMPRGLVCLWS